jgi:solute:Na+ symporter, SSS family
MHSADYCILAAYFGLVLYIGIRAKRKTRTGEDFFLSGRSLSSWMTGIAYMSANLGSLELMGFVANGAKYGMFTNQLYWIGSIPAMIFSGLVMTPIFYRNRVKSVPEYLKMRYDEKTRTLNAAGFAVLTILTSGINLYGLAIVFKVLFNWPINLSIFVAAGTVLAYVTWGGLRASIYTEVLQFFLIVIGLLPLTILALHAVGGGAGLAKRLPFNMMHTWLPVFHPAGTKYGGGLFSIIVGLGFVVSFAYWSTDFLVMQRTFAARDLASAQRTPIIAAFAKAIFPIFTVAPGLVALVVMPHQIQGNYNLTLPLMLVHFYPAGLLGIGITALLASFMSGMAGNITAFNTVWTYDLYQTYIAPGRSDQHYLRMGQIATVAGVLISVFAAYMALNFDNIFEYWALLSSIFIGTGFATFLLGISGKHINGTGAFCGMLAGYATAVGNYVLYRRGVLHYGSMMEMDFLGGTWGFMVNAAVAWVVSLAGRRQPDAGLKNLVFHLRTAKEPNRGSWLMWPTTLALAVGVLTIALNVIFR